MPTPVHELEAEVLRLSAADRAHLLELLIESFDRDAQLDEEWLDEALRREAEVKAGRQALVSGPEALAQIRAKLP